MSPGLGNCGSEAWKELPFVEVDDDGSVNCWAPAKIEAGDPGNLYASECALGAVYALRLIEHMQEYADFDLSVYLLDIIRDVAKRGELGGVEIGFFSELGQYILKPGSSKP